MTVFGKTPAPRNEAMAFIAAYDHPDADAYERRITSIARTWLSIMLARHSVQGVVDRIMDEFTQPTPPDYGSGWDDLKLKFTAWATVNGWVKGAKGGKRQSQRLRESAQ